MFEKKAISENLQKSYCYKCGVSLEGAKLVTISDTVVFVAHAVCVNCRAESMITITQNDRVTMPFQSDLSGEEFKKFAGLKPLSYDDVLDLHENLKKDTLWNLLQKKEQK